MTAKLSEKVRTATEGQIPLKRMARPRKWPVWCAF